MSSVDQYKEVLERCFDDIAALKKAHAERIKALEAVAALLYRYRHETPLGHQPHMIAHEVDKALQAAGYNGEGE